MSKIKKVLYKNNNIIKIYKGDGNIIFTFLEPTPNPNPDPDIPEYIANPALEVGDINQITGEPKSSTKYVRTSDFVYMYGKTTLTMENNANSKMKAFCYDENKEFIKGWVNDGGKLYNFKNISNGGSFVAPSNAYYIKCRFHSVKNPTLTIKYS